MPSRKAKTKPVKTQRAAVRRAQRPGGAKPPKPSDPPRTQADAVDESLRGENKE